jgi:hypothetical protein
MRCSSLIGLGLVLLSRVAAAEPAAPDAATRKTARELAREGDKLMHQGECRAALDRLARAYALVNAPTISILEARCLATLGRLVEAADKYEQTRRTPIDAAAPKAFREAVEQAERELGQLRPRIPRLRIVMRGIAPDAPGTKVEVNGRLLPSSRIGTDELVNPGEHIVVASSGTQVERAIVMLAEKESRTVELSFAAPAERPPPPSMTARGEARLEPEGSSQTTWGWVAMGIGAGGLVAGGISGAIALDKKATLDDVCAPRCPPDHAQDIETFRTMRTVSWVGFGAGILGVGVGLGLLATAGSDPPAVDAWLGPSSAGVRGAF